MPARDSYMDGGKPARSAVPQQVDIPGFGGRYYIRIDGTVWRRWKHKDEQLQGQRNGSGWAYTLRTPDGRNVKKTAGGLMRAAYFRNLPPGTVLEHKDGSGRNYAYWNLRPVTRRQKGLNSYRHHDADTVVKIDPRTDEVIAIYRSSYAAAAATSCAATTIRRACNEKKQKPPRHSAGRLPLLLGKEAGQVKRQLRALLALLAVLAVDAAFWALIWWAVQQLRSLVCLLFIICHHLYHLQG